VISKHLVKVICAICVAVAFSFVPRARTAERDLLDRKIPPTVIKGESIDQALGLLTEHAIPIGIEMGDQKLAPARKIDLNLKETSVKEFLDSVIAKDPQYTWKLEEGIIHVWPVVGRDALLTRLLDTKVSHFGIAGGSSRYKIYNDIMSLPEIKVQLVVADVAPMIFLSSGTMQKVEKDVLFTKSNLTLRGLLDRMVIKTDISRWVITRWGEKSEYITLKS
jgi:hypothetical protein